MRKCLYLTVFCLIIVMTVAGAARGGEIVGGNNGSGGIKKDTVVVFQNNQGGATPQFGNGGGLLDLGAIGSIVGTVAVPTADLKLTELLGIQSIIDGLGPFDLGLGDIIAGIVNGATSGLTAALKPLPLNDILNGLLQASAGAGGTNPPSLGGASLGVLNTGGGGGLGGGGGGGLLAGGGGYGGGAGGLLGGGGGGLDLDRPDIEGGKGGLLLSTGKGGIGGAGSGLLDSAGGDGGDTPLSVPDGSGNNGIGGSAGSNGAGGSGFGGGGGSNLGLSSILDNDKLVSTIVDKLLLDLGIGADGANIDDGLLMDVLGGLPVLAPVVGILTKTIDDLLGNVLLSSLGLDKILDLDATLTRLLSPVVDVAVDGILDGIVGSVTGTVGGLLDTLPPLNALTDLGVAGGGGGGITEGGHSSGLVGNSGAGGSLGITAGQLHIDDGENGYTQRYDESLSYDVQEGGSLVVFGGSGGGGGIGLVGGVGGDGYGAENVIITQSGGEVHLVGGVGGGGGLIAGAKGGDGHTGTTTAEIWGGTVNVYGGAGGGANITLLSVGGLTGTEGGRGDGAVLTGTLHGGEINIYAGADGGDITSDLLGNLLDSVLGSGGTPLGFSAQGGAGGGGRVEHLTMNGGTLNLYAGTSEAARHVAPASGGEAEAVTIANNGGALNLYGGRLSGTYTQTDGMLNIGIAQYDATADNGDGEADKALFSGGEINAITVSGAKQTRTIANAQFGGTVLTNTHGDGSQLIVDTADITATGNLHVGANVTLANTANTVGKVTLDTNTSKLSNYAQSGTGMLILSGIDYAADTAAATGVTISGGYVNSSKDGSVLRNATFASGTEIGTNAGGGPTNTLNISNATIQSGAQLSIGTNATLSSTTHGAGTVTLGAGGALGGGYVLDGGGKLLLARDYTSTAGASFAGGTIDTSGGITRTLTGASFTGDTVVQGTGGALTLSDAKFGNSGVVLGIGTGVSLTSTNHNLGTVRLDAGGTLGNGYTLDDNGQLLLARDYAPPATGVTFAGGTIDTSGGARTLTGALFTGDTKVQGTGGDLTLSGAKFGSSATVLGIGAGVSLVSTTHSLGTVRLDTGGTLGNEYTLDGVGQLLLASDYTPATGVTFKSGTIDTSGGARTLTGALFSGDTKVQGSGGNLTLSGAQFGSSGVVLGIGNRVSLTGTAHSLGTVRLDAGGTLGSGYTLDDNGQLLLARDYTSPAAGVTFAGGTIDTFGNVARTLTGALFSGDTKVQGTDGGLTLSGAKFDNSTTVLGIGSNVSLVSTTHTAGTVRLDAGGTLGAGYSLQDGGELLLAGNGFTVNTSASFVGGSIDTSGGARTLAGALFTGDTAVKGTGGLLTLSGARFGGVGVVLGVGSGVSLTDTVHSTGTVELGGGTLGGGYTLSGDGKLLLADNGFSVDAAAKFTGGTIDTSGGARTLTGALFSGNTKLQGTGGLLTLSGANIDGAATLGIGSNVSLTNTAHSWGKVRLEDGGTLGGGYVLDDYGTLLLAGSGTINAAAKFAGGTIDTSGGATRTLTGASFTGDTRAFGTDGVLNIVGGSIAGGANLSVESGATLGSLTHTAGTVTLRGTGKLADGYTLAGGTLALGRDGTYAQTTYDASRAVLKSGVIRANNFGRELIVGEITGGVQLTVLDDLSSLKVSGATVNIASDAAADFLSVGKNVTLDGAELVDGSILLGTGGKLSGPYTQGAGGTLILAGGDVANSITVGGGTVESRTVGERLSNIEFADGVNISLAAGVATDAGESSILLSRRTVDGEFLTLGDNVTLDGGTLSGGRITLGGGSFLSGAYTQIGGSLVLAGGDASGVTGGLLSGGNIEVNIVGGGSGGASLSNITFADDVGITLTSGGLTVNAATVSGGDFALKSGITLNGTSLTGGSITLGGGTLAGDYTQSGGTLNLNGNLNLAAPGMTNTLSGGTVSASADSALSGADIGAGTVTATAVGSGTELVLSNIDIAAGGNLQLGVAGGGTDGSVVFADTLHDSGTITLNKGGSLSAGYTQNGGDLVLAGGNADAAGMRFTSGSVTATVTDTLTGAAFDGKVSLGAGGGELTLSGSKIEGSAELDIGANVILSGETNLSAGQVTLGSGGSLEGNYTQSGGGKLILNGGGIVGGTSVTLSGGTLQSNMRGSTLAVGSIDGGGVALTTNGGESSLTLTGTTVNIGTGAELKVGGSGTVTLEGGTLANGTLTLGTGGTLDGGYTQGAGGTLALAGGTVTAGAAGEEVTLNGGAVKATTSAGGSLTNATITADVELAGAGGTLTLDGTTIDYTAGAGIDLAVGADVVLKNTGLVDGTVRLGGGNISGGFAMTDAAGSLFLNGGSTADAIIRNTGGGTVTLGKTGSLTGKYEQGPNGLLVLEGGSTTGALITLTGGTVQSNVKGAELGGVDMSGSIVLTTQDVGGVTSTLTMRGTVIREGTDLTINDNVFMVDSTLENGRMRVDGTSSLQGSYTQVGGKSLLTLAGGSTADIDSVWLKGGKVVVEETASLQNVTFEESAVIIDVAVGEALTLDTVHVDDGGVVTLGDRVTMNDLTLRKGGDLTIGGGSVGGAYTQENGSLTLSGAGLGGADSILFSGGTVKATETLSLGGAGKNVSIDGAVDFSAEGGTLDITGAVVSGALADVGLGANVVMNNTRLTEGTITLEGGTLGGTYRQSGGGTLALTGGSISGDNFTFSGGTIEALSGDSVLDGADFDTARVTLASTGGSLKITDAGINSGAILDIGQRVTLETATLTDGAGITLSAGGTLSGAYTQNGGTLTLSGGTIATAPGGGNFTLNRGAVVSTVKDYELVGAAFGGEVALSGSGGGITVSGDSSTFKDGSNLRAGTNATLNDITLTDNRTITLEDGGALGGDYVQNGGTLALTGGATGILKADEGKADTRGAESITLAGGIVRALEAGVKLIGALFTDEVEFEFADGGTLDIVEATLGGETPGQAADITVVDGLTLRDSTLEQGSVTLTGGGALAGEYIQNGGTLYLSGGTTTGARSTFAGGEIIATETAGLDDVHFTAEVDIRASNGELTLTNVHITDGAELDLFDNVVLKGTELEQGSIILREGSTLAESYLQRDGTLTLAGGETGGATATFDGGNIKTIGDAKLTDVHFTNEVDIDASGGSLWIEDVHITEKGELDLFNNVTIYNVELEQGGIILKTGSALGGFYKQSEGGTLTLAGGDTNQVSGSEFTGGNLISQVEGSEVKLAKITGGVVLMSVDDSLDAAADLLMNGTEVVGGVLQLADKVRLDGGIMSGGGISLETGSRLVGSYTQSGGELMLSGGDASAAKLQLSGGAVTASVTSVIGALTVGVDPESVVFLGGEGGAELRMSSVTVNGGTMVLDEGATLTGEYVQNDGVLYLLYDNFKTEDAWFHGGDIHAATGGAATLTGVHFIDDRVTMTTDEGSSLVFADSYVGDGAEVVVTDDSIAMDITIQDAGSVRNLGSNVVINAIAKGGSYTQEHGTLTLADGVSTEGGTVNLLRGSVVAAENGAATLHGATVSGGADIRAGETGGALTLAKLHIDGAVFTAGAKALVDSVEVMNGGHLVVGGAAAGDILDVALGDVTLTGAGNLRFANAVPGNTATISNLSGGDGVLHLAVDLGTGESDFFIIENSDGNYQLALDVAGDGAGVDLVRDVEDGAGYSILGGELSESGAVLMRNTLDSRPEEDGRIWSLVREVAGLTSTAESVANAPAVSLAQTGVGMYELGRHFRNLRDAEGARREADADDFELDLSLDLSLSPAPLFSVWAGNYAHFMSVETFTETSMKLQGMDIGFERRFDAFAGGALYVGAVVGGQWLNGVAMRQSYGRDGSGAGKAFSVGAYGAWMNSGGWYADLAARHFWTDFDLTSFATDGRGISYAPRRSALALSASAGRRISFGLMDEWFVDPGVNLTGIWLRDSVFSTSDGQRVEYGSTKSLQATAGIALGYAGERVTPYLEAAVVHGFDGRTDVYLKGTSVRNDPSGTRFRGSLGASVRVTDSLSLSVDAAFERGRGYRDVNGNFGINFSW